MKITVGFSRAKDWWLIGSQTIRLAEKRPYSHVYVRYTSEDTGIELVAQASHGCVNVMNYDLFQDANIIVEEYEFEITPAQFYRMREYIDQNLGVIYSRLQILLIAIKKLFHIEVNIHYKDQSFICSEFAGRICEVLHILTLTDQDYLTPSDLNKLIKEKINK